jgi:hypothetical protein
MTMIYRVTLDVRGPTLPTLLSTIDGDSSIRLVAVTNAADPALPPAPLPPARPPKETNGVATPSQQPSSRYANGRRLKSIRGCDLVVETLRCGPATMEELKHTFEHREFSPMSAPSYVSRMLREGTIVRSQHGRYSLSKGD